MDENQKSVMDAGGAIPTLSSAWAMFKNNAIIAIEPAATRVFGIFITGLTWFRTTGVKVIQSVIGVFQDLLNGPLSPLIDIFTNVKDTVILFFNAMTGGETDMSLPWAQTVIDIVNRVKDGFNEVKGGFTAFKAAFVDGSDEVTSSGFAGFLEQLGVYARDIADVFQKYVVPPLETFAEIVVEAGKVALPLILDAIVLVKDVVIGLGEAVFGVVNFFKDHDVAARVLAITIGTILLPTLVGLTVSWATSMATAIASGATTLVIWGMLQVSAATNAVRAAASWLAAQVSILAGWVSTAAGAVASFVAKTAGAVLQSALTAAAWLGVQGRIAAGWIATKVTAITSFVGKAASATAQAAVTSAVWLGSQAKVAAGWTATKAVAIASYIATSASAVLEAVKTSAAWVASNAKTAASFLVAKASMLAVATATGLMTAAQWLLNAAVNANPFSLIVIALVAVGAGLYMLWTKSETFRNIVTSAFNGVKSVIMGVWNWVSENWPLLLAILTGPIGMAVYLITKNWDSIKHGAAAAKDWIVEKWNDLVGFVTGLPGRIGSAASGMWDGIQNAFKGAINYIIRAWNSLEFKIPGFSFSPVKWEGFTLGLPDIPMLASGGIAGRTKDGKLWGPGTSTSDSILGLDKRGLPTALVSTDEGVVMADAMANGGAPLVAALNRGWTPSAGDLHAMFPDLPRFKEGTYGPFVTQPKKPSAFANASTTGTAQTSAFANASTTGTGTATGPTSSFYKDLYANGSAPVAAPTPTPVA